jgi:hypothetical protein
MVMRDCMLALERHRADEAVAKIAQLSVIKDKHMTSQQKLTCDQHVYIASNPHYWMDDVYKVGKSANTATGRVSSLNTSHPVDDSLVILHDIKCHDAAGLESRIHNILNCRRVDKSREFFHYPLTELIELCDQISHKMEFDISDYNISVAKIIEIESRHGADAEAIVVQLKTAIIPATQTSHFTNMRGANDELVARFIKCGFDEWRNANPTATELILKFRSLA